MNGDELREAFRECKRQLPHRNDLIQFINTSLEEELSLVRRSVMESGGVDPGDLYMSGMLMGLLIKKYLDENEMSAENIVATVESYYGSFFRRLRGEEDGLQTHD